MFEIKCADCNCLPSECKSSRSPKKYPAMLLGRMGVDKKFRKKGIGSSICKFCQGLADVVSESVACMYIMLHPTLNKILFYQRLGFVKSINPPTYLMIVGKNE